MVLDASAILEFLRCTPAGRAVGRHLAPPDESLHAPHLVDLEVAQVLRRYVLNGILEPGEARDALDVFLALDIERHAHDLLLDRIWELSGNVSAHDAAYVALAEALDAPLITHDARLGVAPGHRSRIVVI